MIQRKRRIVLLGATGSIGESTLQVLRHYRDCFELIGIASKQNFQEMAKIAKEFDVPEVCLFNEQPFLRARESGLFSGNCNLYMGEEGLKHLATLKDADIVVLAMTGIIGIRPALAAIELGKTLALANKEILVMAGSIVMEAAKKHNALILPMDSEHNAIFQCLEGQDKSAVDFIVLTASGGAFRDLSMEKLKTVTPQEALKHPTWRMGRKITIDCATMANKGLELIEAHWLFNVGIKQLKVLIHPQSIIHSMVQFIDGSIMAQLSPTSMTFPIQNCLFFPKRFPSCNGSLDLTQYLKLELFPPNFERYPCLRLAMEALRVGGLAPAIFNAANEVAVEAFNSLKLPFIKISEVIDKTLQVVSNKDSNKLVKIIETHNEAIAVANKIINEL